MDATTISWNELRKPAGHLLMIGLADGGVDALKFCIFCSGVVIESGVAFMRLS